MIELLKRFVPVVSFIAFSTSVAVGAHTIIGWYADDDPAYVILQGTVTIGKTGNRNNNRGGGIIRATLIKARPECKREHATIVLRYKDQSDRGFEVDMGGILTPGRHSITGEFAVDHPSDIDTTVAPIFQTIHDCGKNRTPVIATCAFTYPGAAPIICNEE